MTIATLGLIAIIFMALLFTAGAGFFVWASISVSGRMTFESLLWCAVCASLWLYVWALA